MQILVTGGAGFIGTAVTRLLLERGHTVRVLDCLLPAAHGPDPQVRLPSDVEFRRDDVRDAAAVRSALVGVDAVCHQAAMVGLGVDLADLPDYAGINDLGTAVLLAAMAAAGTPRLVLASSMVVYGEGAYSCAEHGPTAAGPRRSEDLEAGRFEPACPRCGAPLRAGFVQEDARLDPRSVYAATKVAQEHLCTAWALGTGATVSALRYHNVYGPGMPRDTPYAGVASIFRSSLERGDAPIVFEDGGQRRDFVHVCDVAAANVAALSSDCSGPLNVASGTPHTVGEMAQALAEAMGGPPPVITGRYRAGDVRHVVASNARSRQVLDLPPPVGFAEGMREFATAPLRGGPSG